MRLVSRSGWNWSRGGSGLTECGEDTSSSHAPSHRRPHQQSASIPLQAFNTDVTPYSLQEVDPHRRRHRPLPIPHPPRLRPVAHVERRPPSHVRPHPPKRPPLVRRAPRRPGTRVGIERQTGGAGLARGGGWGAGWGGAVGGGAGGGGGVGEGRSGGFSSGGVGEGGGGEEAADWVGGVVWVGHGGVYELTCRPGLGWTKRGGWSAGLGVVLGLALSPSCPRS